MVPGLIIRESPSITCRSRGGSDSRGTAENSLWRSRISGSRFQCRTTQGGTFGEKKVLTFLESFDEELTEEELEKIAESMIPHLMAEDITEALTPRLIQKSFGMSIEQLDAEAKAWIRARL